MNAESQTIVVTTHLRNSAAIILATAELCAPSILAAARLIASAFKTGGKLLLCGNGGSAADCQHMATELTSRLTSDFARPGLPAIALTTDTSFLTAYANDFDFDGVFARQVQAIGRPGDVLLAISTSGKSKNVIAAVQTAKEIGLSVIALTGTCGERIGEPVGVSHGIRTVQFASERPVHAQCSSPLQGKENESGRMPLLQHADVSICIPSEHTQHVQEAHLAIEHILCHLIERAVFGERGTGNWGICPSSNPKSQIPNSK